MHYQLWKAKEYSMEIMQPWICLGRFLNLRLAQILLGREKKISIDEYHTFLYHVTIEYALKN